MLILPAFKHRSIKQKLFPHESKAKVTPVLVAPGAHIFHRSEAAGDASKAVEVIQDGATCLQVIGVSCGLVGAVREQ